MKKITVAHLANIALWPPVINLLENLLNNGHAVRCVSCGMEALPLEVLRHPNFQYTNIEVREDVGLLKKVTQRVRLIREGRRAVKGYLRETDILWTTTDRTVLFLGSIVKDATHILQLMELVHFCPILTSCSYVRFPIEKYAKKAWKVVVPEINRAYIQKIYWDLPRLPAVLPNKPYQLSSGEATQETLELIEVLRQEKKKILLYLGVFCEDRNFDALIEAVERMDDYRLYLVGKFALSEEEEKSKEAFSSYKNVRYLGYFPAPKHLIFLEYAHIGLLPYSPTKQVSYVSELNALYCAPNKIFEYSGYGVPMLGSDVLGLKMPFEKHRIGACYSETSDSVMHALQYIEGHYDEMRRNCHIFFDSVDLDGIVKEILEE